jgi:hypothetical protein
MALILKAKKVNLFVSSVLFVFWYHSPNILDTPCIYHIISYIISYIYHIIYHIIIPWNDRRIFGPSLAETSLCGTMEPEGCSPCSQQCAASPCRGIYESCPNRQHFIISISLPSYKFFPHQTSRPRMYPTMRATGLDHLPFLY